MAVPGDGLAVVCERDCGDHLVEVSDWLAVSPEFGSECAEDPVGLVRNGKLDQRLNDRFDFPYISPVPMPLRHLHRSLEWTHP